MEKVVVGKLHQINVGFYGVFALVTYFIWCDLQFFSTLTAEQELGFVLNQTYPKTSIKLRMQDHFAHYIFLPFCNWLEVTFKVSKIPGVTPNLITGIHFMFAMASGRLLASTSLLLQCISVMLYEIRTMLDTLDGVVYRAQHSMTSYVSGWGTYGFIIDGVADTLGGIFLTVALIYRLNKYRPLLSSSLLYSDKNARKKDIDVEKSLLESNSESDDEKYGVKRYSKRAVNFTILAYTILVILRSSLWDNFNHGYHSLLATPRPDIPVEKQWEALGFRSTWICLWLWKITSADAFMHYTLISILFNKLWPWVRFNIFFTIPHVLVVSSICYINLWQLRASFGVDA